MAERNKLSIYLIKDEYSASDELILKRKFNLLGSLEDIGNIYFDPSQTTYPAWFNTFFCGKLDCTNVFSSNTRAVLISRVKINRTLTKTFAITMGYGKNMLADNVIEEDFGLRVVLNTIEPSSLRRINKTNVGGNQKTSNEQLPLKSDIDDFGFDIDRDLISTVTGYSNDEDFVVGMITGGDLLSLTAEVDINNLMEFLKKVYNRYISNRYKLNFGWVDHIKKIKDKKLIENLDSNIVTLINATSPNVWMAVPEVVDWENIEGFRYCGKELQDDIDIALVMGTFRNPLSSTEQLQSKRIYAIRKDNGETYASWSAYKCIYAEIDFNGSAYCLNNGNWYCVEKNFVESVNSEYNRIPISSMIFADHLPEHKKECQYTQAFVESDPNHLLCMDAKTISHGGGRSKVELCDILTDDNTYIHIKPYTSSAALSHLFNQALVSANLVISDDNFRDKANQKISEEGGSEAFLIPPNPTPTIIFAIISQQQAERPSIPFFSKVALRHTWRQLKSFGCKVYIKNITKSE